MSTDTDLQALVNGMQEGWNTHDGARYAEVFTDDADFITVAGLRAHGRDMIAAGHQEIFDTIFADTRISLEVNSIRYLRPDVAILDLTSQMQGGKGPRTSYPFAVAARNQDAWQLVALHNMVPIDRPVAGPVEAGLAS